MSRKHVATIRLPFVGATHHVRVDAGTRQEEFWQKEHGLSAGYTSLELDRGGDGPDHGTGIVCQSEEASMQLIESLVEAHEHAFGGDPVGTMVSAQAFANEPDLSPGGGLELLNPQASEQVLRNRAMKELIDERVEEIKRGELAERRFQGAQEARRQARATSVTGRRIV